MWNGKRVYPLSQVRPAASLLLLHPSQSSSLASLGARHVDSHLTLKLAVERAV
jgi:hypothetical protein